MMEDHVEGDICRVCRMGATLDKPLHYPCLCTGSIKYIHQDCLVQWLKHSKKEFCELCSHKFIFKPVYSPDMPSTIPMLELLKGLGKNIFRALRFWLHYTLVVVAWLGIVPLTAYRIYRCLFSGSVHSLLTLPMDILSLENIFMDCLLGALVVATSMGAFILLLWLREQIVIHGGPDWLNNQEEGLQVPQLDGIFRARFLNRENGANNRDNANPDNNAAQANNGGQVVDPFAAANQPNNGQNDWGEFDNERQQIEFGENDEGGNGPVALNPAGDPVAADANGGNAENAVEGGEGNNGGWNPDAIMEDLTWEKFLGLDGSFVFLEHVFWIISLNTSFILVFAFCPYYVGQIVMNLFGFDRKLTDTGFDGFVVLVFGYFLLAFGLVAIHWAMKYTNVQRIRKTVGLCYVAVKVALLMAVEVGLFPLICGWWLDICSLPLFAMSPKDRKESFLYAPGTATFLHWLVGMLYVFYFAAFIILLREIQRPGVLWFLRNINDPQFHPVKEMIQLSVLRHARRFMLSLVVFGTTVMVLVWIPVQLIKRFTKSLIPFNVSLNSDAPLSEMSLELLLLQVILPAFLEQGHARKWLKSFIQHWVNAMSYILDLRSYLIGDVEVIEAPWENVVHVDNAGKWQQGHPPAGVPLENSLEGVGSPTVRAYIRTKLFPLKLTLLVISAIGSFITAAFLIFTLPVKTGRWVLSFVFGDIVIHELYTAAAGFYVLWLSLRLLNILHNAYPLGIGMVARKCKVIATVVLKVATSIVVLVGVVPLLLGLFFELVVVIPLRVPLDQTPLVYIWQDWALGILHLKIMCAIVMIGPDWWLKDAVDRAYRNGIMNMDVAFILKQIAYPIVTTLMLAICIPFVLTAGFLPLLGLQRELVVLCFRRIYPLSMFFVILIGVLVFQGKQFKALYERIKNEKYLIGKVLVNYEPDRKKTMEPVEDVTPPPAAAIEA